MDEKLKLIHNPKSNELLLELSPTTLNIHESVDVNKQSPAEKI